MPSHRALPWADDHKLPHHEVRCAAQAIAAVIKSYASNVVRIGLETGPTATWLWTELRNLGLPLICIDARHAKAANLHRRTTNSRPLAGTNVPGGTLALVRSPLALRCSNEQNALHTLIHHRHLTPSCGGHVSTAERTMDPARMFMESLTPRPELENSLGQNPKLLPTASCPLPPGADIIGERLRPRTAATVGKIFATY